jgi:hypothetical protein
VGRTLLSAAFDLESLTTRSKPVQEAWSKTNVNFKGGGQEFRPTRLAGRRASQPAVKKIHPSPEVN